MPAKRGEALRLNPLLTLSGQHQTSPSGYACASCDRPCGGFSIYPRGGVSDMSVVNPRFVINATNTAGHPTFSEEDALANLFELNQTLASSTRDLLATVAE